MSYHATGDLADTLASTGKAAIQVADDPYLPEVVCQVLRLGALEEGKNPGPSCPRVSTKAYPGRGIGLRYAVVPLRIAVKIRERPAVSILIAGGILLGIFGLGYLTGRSGRAA